MNIVGFNGFAQSGKDTSGRHLIENHNYTRYAFADRIREILLAMDPRINGSVSVSGLLAAFDGNWEAAEKHRVYGAELRHQIDLFDKHVAKGTFEDHERTIHDLRDDLLTLDPFLDGDITLAELVTHTCDGSWELAKAHRLYGFEVRRIMQQLGTEVVRYNYGGTAWVDVVARKIEAEQPANAVITDVRFAEEARWVQSFGGPVIEVTRTGTVSVNGHASEKKLPAELISASIANDGTLEDLYQAIDAVVSTTPVAQLAA